VRIDCYLSPECVSEKALRENIRKALELAGLEADLNIHRLSAREGQELHLKGSPAIFINGCNMFPVQESMGFS